MQQFLSSNATLLVVLLGVALAASVVAVLTMRRARQKYARALTAVRNLQDVDRRYAVDTVAASCVHDLNNLLLVLSMEISRLQDRPQSDDGLLQSISTLEEIMRQGHDLAQDMENHRYAGPNPGESCELLSEIGNAIELANLAGLARIDLTQSPAAREELRCARPAHDVHLLVIAMARAVATESHGVVMRVVEGAAEELSGDDEEEWVRLIAEAANPGQKDGNAALRTTVVKLSQRMLGHCSVDDGMADLIVSLPVSRS